MENAGTVLLALHLIADFPLQTDAMAQNKLGGGAYHLAHVAVHLSLYLVVLYPIYGLTGVSLAMFVAGCHGLIDTRRWAEPKDEFEDYPIWVDQSLHVASIAVAVVVFS
jgi:hypothetical protein